MQAPSKLHIDELYPKYKDLVINVSRKFIRMLPDEDLEDLTQTCWEQVVRKYPKYEPEKSVLTTWLVMVSKSTLYNMLRDLNRDKRAVRLNSISLDSMTNGKDKYL